MYVQLAQWISVIYPISEQAAEAMRPFSEAISAAPLLYVLLLIAVVPAICEELAFRGFIFGGLVRDQSAGRAVLLTAVIFGISHGVLQQSICATIMGLLLGWISWKTGSVLPSILIHVTNNALSASLERIVQSGSSSAEFFVRSTAQGPQYQSVWSVIAILIAGIILCYFHSIDHDGDGDVLTDRCNDPCTSIVPVHVG
jgi:sodium transport system permease protein